MLSGSKLALWSSTNFSTSDVKRSVSAFAFTLCAQKLIQSSEGNTGAMHRNATIYKYHTDRRAPSLRTRLLMKLGRMVKSSSAAITDVNMLITASANSSSSSTKVKQKREPLTDVRNQWILEDKRSSENLVFAKSSADISNSIATFSIDGPSSHI